MTIKSADQLEGREQAMRSRIWQWGCVLMGAIALGQLGAACAAEDDALDDASLDDAGSDTRQDVAQDQARPDSSDAGSGDASDARVDGTPDGGDANAEADAKSDTSDSSDENASDAPDDGDLDVTDASDADAVVDGGLDADTDASDAEATGCLDSTNAQVFTSQMFGCPGVVLWDDRNTLCRPGCSACPVSEWVALDGAIPPAHHYWTDDILKRGGGTSPKCFAAPLDGGAVVTCRSVWDGGLVASPMRVCVPYTDSPFDASVDPEGNVCDFTGCGYLTSMPDGSSLSLGGCSNPTAGTLCCCP